MIYRHLGLTSENALLPSLRGLEALAALSRHGSLTAAAQALGVTRSALSHRVADLERELGVALIVRAGRIARLTDDAIALLAAVGDALERIQTAVEPLRRRRKQLRVSTVGTFASCWLLPRLSAFRDRHPDIEIAVSTTQRPVDLDREDWDCAIRHGLGTWPGLIGALLFRETLVPVAAPHADKDLHGRSVIRARSRYRDWTRWWTSQGLSGTPHGGGLLVETRAQALEAALAGTGIAMTDMAYARPHLAAGRLVQLGPPITLDEGYHLVHASKRGNGRLLAAFQGWISRAASLETGL